MAEQQPIARPIVLQVPSTVKSLIEALVFGAREPLSFRQIQALYEDQAMEGGDQRKIDYDSIKRVVEELNGEYAAADRAYRIIEIAGGYQFATLPAYAEWLGKLYKEQARRKLSQSSIETLAIIAYRQPITKPEIESIRGVNCDYVLSTLLEKDLATIVGRAPTVGRPLLYGTSKEFLKHFGLNDLNDLPRPREIQEILGDSQFESERRMLEAQQGAEEKKEEDFKSRLPHIPKRKPELDDDVRIVPKKRSREIKLRQDSEETPAPAQDTGGEQLPLTPRELLTSDSVQDQQPAQNVPASVGQEPILTPENRNEQPVPEVEPDDVFAQSSEVPSVSLKSAALTQSEVSEEIPRETAGTTALESQNPEEIQSAGDFVPPSLEDGISEKAEDLTELLASPEEPVVELSLQENAALSETPAVALPGLAEQADEVTPSLDVTAQGTEAPPPAEALPETLIQGTVDSHREPVHEDGATEHHSSQNKSRWSSWKEKIQGFIKKLFG